MINILTQFLIDFWSNLGRFWEEFGLQVGTKLGPNAYKIRPQNQSKKLLLFGRLPSRFWVDFGSILGPRGVHPKCFLGVLRGLEAILGPRWSPRWSQEAPRSPQTTPKTDFGQILKDFCQFFERFLVNFFDFRLNFGVLVCWFAGCLVLCLACLLN